MSVTRSTTRQRARRLRAAGAMLPFVLTACYHSVPVVDVAAVDPVRPVEITLTARGSEELAPQLGGPVATMVGAVRTVRRDTIVLALARTEQTSRIGTRWQQQEFAVDRRYVAAINTRRVSRGRTALLVGATLAVVATTLGFAAGSGGNGGSHSAVTSPPN